MSAIIDRFEGRLAVLEVDGAEKKVPRSELPDDAREGDAVDLETMTIDRAGSEDARARLAAARARAKKKPFKGL